MAARTGNLEFFQFPWWILKQLFSPSMQNLFSHFSHLKGVLVRFFSWVLQRWQFPQTGLPFESRVLTGLCWMWFVISFNTRDGRPAAFLSILRFTKISSIIMKSLYFFRLEMSVWWKFYITYELYTARSRRWNVSFFYHLKLRRSD